MTDKFLKNKVILITGAGKNIGKEVALLSAQQGAVIILADIDVKAGQAVSDKINSLGQQALFCKTDISKGDEVTTLIETALNRFERIDILINNAVCCPIQSFTDSSVDIWDKSIDTNLKGVYLCSKAAAGSMICNKKGMIINITSGSVKGGKGIPFMSAYCASKGGIVSFTHSIGAELKDKGIDVFAFFVSVCDTDGTKKDLPRLAKKCGISYGELMKRIVPATLKRLLMPREVARAIIYSIKHKEVIKRFEVDDLEVYPHCLD